MRRKFLSSKQFRSIRRTLPLAALALALGGCLLPPDHAGRADGAASEDFRQRLPGKPADGDPANQGKLTLRQVDAWTNAFADRWASYIQDATRRILAGSCTPEERKAALALQASSISSVYDIAVRTDPLTQLLDMVVLASLEYRVWVVEGEADHVFGERGAILKEAVKSLYDDITLTSINALNSEQYEQLTTTIDDWRRDHPDIRAVEFVRFSEFAAARAVDLSQQIRSSGLFAPIDEATRVAEDLKALAQRGMWVGIRAPQLLSWQAEGFVDQVMTRPEIAEALAGNDNLFKSADRLSRTAAELPAVIKAEREALIKALDDREEKLGSTVREVRTTVEESRKLLADTDPMLKNADHVVRSAQELTKAMTEMVKAVDGVTARFTDPKPAPAGAPPSGASASPQPDKFAIADYTRAAEQLTSAVKELNTLVASANGLVASPAWQQRLDEMDRLGRQQIVSAKVEAVHVTDALFSRALILLAAFFAGLFGWTLLKWKLK